MSNLIAPAPASRRPPRRRQVARIARIAAIVGFLIAMTALAFILWRVTVTSPLASARFATPLGDELRVRIEAGDDGIYGSICLGVAGRGRPMTHLIKFDPQPSKVAEPCRIAFYPSTSQVTMQSGDAVLYAFFDRDFVYWMPPERSEDR